MALIDPDLGPHVGRILFNAELGNPVTLKRTEIRIRFVPRSSRVRPANDRETSRSYEKRRAMNFAGQRANSIIVAGSEIGPGNTLKVETGGFESPLGLPGETRRRSSRLDPGQGAKTGLQATRKRRPRTLSSLVRAPLVRICPADDITTSRRGWRLEPSGGAPRRQPRAHDESPWLPRSSRVPDVNA